MSETSEILELMKKQTREIHYQNELHEKNIISIENKTKKCEELSIIKEKEIIQNDKLLKLKEKEIETIQHQLSAVNNLIESSDNMIKGINMVLEFINNNPTQHGIDTILTFIQTSNVPILLHVLKSLNINEKDELIDQLYSTLKEIGKTKTQINMAPSFDVGGDFNSEDFNYTGRDKK